MSSAEDTAKQAALDAVTEVVKSLETVIEGLRSMEKAVSAHPPALLQVTRRLVDAEKELFDQRSLLAHLRAQHVRVKPMSDEARQTLKRLLTRLDQFVKADQAFHRRLEFAEVVIGLVNDHEQEVREMTT